MKNLDEAYEEFLINQVMPPPAPRIEPVKAKPAQPRPSSIPTTPPLRLVATNGD